MRQLREYTARSRIGRGLKAAAALLAVLALGAPNLAYAAPHGGGSHGGGGFHGGVSRAGAGGFHGGGGGFHAGGIRGAVAHGGFPGSHHGFHGRNGGPVFFAPDVYGAYGSYPADDYGDDYYDGEQPSASQVWYYCSDPAGYYPYVTQCSSGWQMVPAG
jgi:hypothetical protein